MKRLNKASSVGHANTLRAVDVCTLRTRVELREQATTEEYVFAYVAIVTSFDNSLQGHDDQCSNSRAGV
jgi:hypothetical protein